MAEIYTPNPVSTFTNDTSAVNVVNGNFTAISTALLDCLSLGGTSPNQMKSQLDMNSNQIINLAPPLTINSPARLVDVVSNPTIVVPPVGTSGATVPLLNGNNTWSGTNTFAGIAVNGVTYPASPSINTVPVVTGTNTITYELIPGSSIANATITSGNIATNTITTGNIAPATITGSNIASATITGSNIAGTTVAGSNLVNNTVGNAQIRQGVARSVIGVTGNATANVADIQGSTRQVLAINTAGTGLVFAQPQGDQLLGTVTNDNATAGNVGEYTSATLVSGSAIALTTSVISNITSVSLTAGDWDVWATGYFNYTTAVINFGTFALVTVTATTSNVPGLFGQLAVATSSTATNISVAIPPVRFSLSGTTTIFLTADAGFSGTVSAYGIIQARRVR